MNDYQWLGLAVLPFLVALVLVLTYRARKRPPMWDVDETDQAGA